MAFRSGDYPEAVAVYEEAIADLRATGDLQGLGATLGRLATVLWNQGDTRRANAVLTEAIELLEREPPGPELVSAYVRMAGDRVVAGHASEALDWADKALALADELGGLPRMRPRALDARGMARCDLGDFGGMDDLRAGLALGLELGSGYDTAVLYNNLAEPVWLVEGPEAALAVCEDGVDFAERRGLTEAAMWLRASTLGPLLDLGRWEEVGDPGRRGDRLGPGPRRRLPGHRLPALRHPGPGLAGRPDRRPRPGRPGPAPGPGDRRPPAAGPRPGQRGPGRARERRPGGRPGPGRGGRPATAERAGGRRFLGQYLADMVRVAAGPPRPWPATCSTAPRPPPPGTASPPPPPAPS